MKTKKASIFIALLIVLSTTCSAESSVVGKWEAQLGGYPWVVLNVAQNQNQLSGTAIFFALRRDFEGGPPTGVIGERELRLNKIRKEGNAFFFEVTRPSDNETLSFEMKLTSDNVGFLQSTGSTDAYAKGVKMIKQK